MTGVVGTGKVSVRIAVIVWTSGCPVFVPVVGKVISVDVPPLSLTWISVNFVSIGNSKPKFTISYKPEAFHHV